MADPTPEEIARVEAWQVSRKAERDAAAAAARAERDRLHEERRREAEEAAASKFRGKRISEVDVTLDSYYAEVRGLAFTFEDGSSVDLGIYTYGDSAELEIEWTAGSGPLTVTNGDTGETTAVPLDEQGGFAVKLDG